MTLICLTERHWNLLFTNQLWIAVVIVTIACGEITTTAHADLSIKGPAQSNVTECAKRDTCVKCTEAAPLCSWSFDEQFCDDTANRNLTDGVDSDLLLVRETSSCPKFLVSYSRIAVNMSLHHTVATRITNDPTGAFAARLGRSAITCHLNDMVYPGEWERDSAQVSCNHTERIAEGSPPAEAVPSSVVYFSASMDGIPLEFDSAEDHYATVYHNVCYEKQQLNAECTSCFWDDDEYRYYCRWCSRNDMCAGLYQRCDIRWVSNNSLAENVKNVYLQCPAVRIESVEPKYGPWTGGTEMRIAIGNHRIMAENKIVIVTVAGSKCLLPTTSKDGNTVTCTISPTNSSRLDQGPVEVMYVPSENDGSQPSLTLRSNQTFYFVDPEVTSIRPACGPITGGTQLSIRGNFLDAGNAVRVYVRENITCAVTGRSYNDVTCVTGAADGATSGQVKLVFDNYLSKSLYHPLFVYSEGPQIDGGQTFGGIASGGTRLPVAGRHFTCIDSPLVYVKYNGIQHVGSCDVLNDTRMVCRPPKINRPAPKSVTVLEFGFQADFDKKILLLEPPANCTGYLLHPDPVYTDFETDDDGTVIVHGLRLDQGYSVADDLTIQYNDSTEVCAFQSVESQRVVCGQPSPETVELTRDEIVVTVGNNLVYEIKRKPALRARSMLLTVLFSGITIVSLIITVVVGVVYCAKIAIMRSKQQTVMQSSSCDPFSSTLAVLQQDADKDGEEDKHL